MERAYGLALFLFGEAVDISSRGWRSRSLASHLATGDHAFVVNKQHSDDWLSSNVAKAVTLSALTVNVERLAVSTLAHAPYLTA